MPARCAPPSGFSDVSSAPHSLPFANITCCMRVSFESGRETTSSWAGSAPNSSRQQPSPTIVEVRVSLMQKLCGVDVVGASPDPGCCCFGGTPYCPTVRILFESVSDGVAEFSDDVFVRLHTISLFEVCGPPVPATGLVASSPAFELRKYSVPPLPVSNGPVPGDCAGQTVKPGCVEPASLGTLTRPDVSMWAKFTDDAPAASCAFESA